MLCVRAMRASVTSKERIQVRSQTEHRRRCICPQVSTMFHELQTNMSGLVRTVRTIFLQGRAPDCAREHGRTSSSDGGREQASRTD